jgi:hypothetical protein
MEQVEVQQALSLALVHLQSLVEAKPMSHKHQQIGVAAPTTKLGAALVVASVERV